MEVKRQVFPSSKRRLRPGAVLATNTSYLDVNEIAAVLEDPSRLVGLHFFAPAHIMKLLEIVRGDATSDRALATGFALAKRLRKLPVLAGVCDGFIGNRILARYREAADTVMMDGANALGDRRGDGRFRLPDGPLRGAGSVRARHRPCQPPPAGRHPRPGPALHPHRRPDGEPRGGSARRWASAGIATPAAAAR